MRLRMIPLLALLFGLSLSAGVARATTILSGYLNDQANGALVGSDLGAAQFADDYGIANNVALYQISILTPGSVSFTSKGFLIGGVDPYFTLFSGSGTGATFLGSNYDQAYLTGGDFTLSYLLTAGNYTVALGAFGNMSFAENLGTGTLGDGFISLGEPYALGSYYYDVAITTPGPAVPEPCTMLLVGVGLASLLAFRRKTGASAA